MNLRKNNGFTGVDISIAMIIILIFIPTVFGITYNVQKNNKAVNRKSKSVSIATDILETAKTYSKTNIKIEENEDFANSMLEKNYEKVGENQITDKETKIIYSYSGDTGDEEHYKIEISLTYPYDEENTLVRKIKVTVEYPEGNLAKKIDISTVLQKN